MELDRTLKVKDSTNIKAMSYDKSNKKLYVYFQNDIMWEYDNVPISIFGVLAGSVSVGKAFNEMVKNTYIGRELINKKTKTKV